MREHQKPFIILALNAGNSSLEGDILNRVGVQDSQVKPLMGVYTHEDGHKVHEHSYLIVYNSDTQKQVLINLARKFSQESVLLVDEERQATLVFTRPPADGTEIPKDKRLGHFREASKHIAKAGSAYSFNPVNGKYYIC